MKSLNKDFLPVHVAGDVYTKEEVYTKDEVDALIEGAGGASGLVVNVIRDLTAVPPSIYLDKTYTEITTALLNGIHPVVLTDGEGSYDVDTIAYFSNVDGYSVTTAASEGTFTSETADGVLTYTS